MSSLLRPPDPVHSNPGDRLAELLDQAEAVVTGPLGGPVPPLARWIDRQAAYYRGLGSDSAAWLAAEIQQLADLARLLHAATVDQLVDRRDVMDRYRAMDRRAAMDRDDAMDPYPHPLW